MADAKERLIDAAMALRAAAPVEWSNFCAHMAAEAAAANMRMVSCSPELILRAQGMAIQANETAVMLSNAPKLHEQYATARMKQNVGQRHPVVTR